MLLLFQTMQICAAALGDVAYAALAGVLLNRLWIGGVNSCNQRFRICMGTLSAVQLVIFPFQLLLLAGSMTGNSSWTDAWRAIPDVSDTHAGRALILSFCFASCLFLFSCFAASLRRTRGILIGICLEVGLIACRVLNGHAASDGDFTLREGVQFLHLSSIAAWGGGVLVAGLITVPYLSSTAETNVIKQFGKRLSRTVTVALAIVILSGTYNSWKGLGGSLSPLPHTAWGRMLVLKLSFVLLALVHGVRVHFLLRDRHPWTQSQTAIMRRWIRREALLMFFVFLCSAWLANLPPADM